MRVALLGAEEQWMAAYCRRIMQLNFADDRDIGSMDVVSEALEALHLPGQQIIADAQSDANKLRLREQTAAAAAKGIFGAPTFFVGDEMFWGNDRLDDALDFCDSIATRG
jgi:2-hydroxychromene-2-carboxylate isomerase